MAVNKVCSVVWGLRSLKSEYARLAFSMSSEVFVERRVNHFPLAKTAHPGHAFEDCKVFGGTQNSPRQLRKSFLRKVYTKATFP